MIIKINLGLGRKNNSDILPAAEHYTTSMTGNALFAATDIKDQVTATVGATANLRNAMNLPISETKSDQVRVCRDALNRALTVLAGKVEAVANSAGIPDGERAGIVHAAGMEMKGRSTRDKQVFAVTQGDEAGSVYLTAEAGPGAHEWQYAKDTVTFTDRTGSRVTLNASVTISGLESYAKYAFFHKAVVPEDETSEWEGPLMIVVH